MARRPKRTKKKIWCVEGKWGKFTDSTSVRPVLDILERTKDYSVKSEHCPIITLDSMEKALKVWLQKGHSAYKILYVACHGDCGAIYPIGSARKNELEIEWFQKVLSGKCHNRIIFFASCGTVGVRKNVLTKFLKETKALAVCGYKGEVDWLKATAFEMLALGEMQFGALTRSGAIAIHKRIQAETGKLCKELKFDMVVRE